MTKLWGDEAGRATKTDRILVLGATEVGPPARAGRRRSRHRLVVAAEGAARDLSSRQSARAGRLRSDRPLTYGPIGQRLDSMPVTRRSPVLRAALAAARPCAAAVSPCRRPRTSSGSTGRSPTRPACSPTAERDDRRRDRHDPRRARASRSSSCSCETTGDRTAADYAAETARQNSLGGDDALLLVAIDDRTDQIWVSDGLDEITRRRARRDHHRAPSSPASATATSRPRSIGTVEALGEAAVSAAADDRPRSPPAPEPTGLGRRAGAATGGDGGIGFGAILGGRR